MSLQSWVEWYLSVPTGLGDWEGDPHRQVFMQRMNQVSPASVDLTAKQWDHMISHVQWDATFAVWDHREPIERRLELLDRFAQLVIEVANIVPANSHRLMYCWREMLGSRHGAPEVVEAIFEHLTHQLTLRNGRLEHAALEGLLALNDDPSGREIVKAQRLFLVGDSAVRRLADIMIGPTPEPPRLTPRRHVGRRDGR